MSKVKKKTQKEIRSERLQLIPLWTDEYDSSLCRRCLGAGLICGGEEQIMESGRNDQDGLTNKGGWINLLRGRSFGRMCNSKADIMIIGEAPGDMEAQMKQVFVGASGQLLEKWIQSSGLSKRKIWLDNAVRCLPEKDLARMDTRKVNKLTGLCSPYLMGEINRLKPKVIILLGSTALKVVTGLVGITAWSGRVVKSREFDCYIIPFLHPSNVLRDRRGSSEKNESALGVFSTAGRLANTKIKFRRLQFDLVDSDVKFERCMREMESAKRISVDFESNTKTPLAPNLKIIGLVLSSSPSKAWFVPFLELISGRGWKSDDAVWGEPNLSDAWSKRMKKLMADASVTKIMQNAAYDLLIFMKLGWMIGPIADTIISSSMLDTFPKRDLDTLSYAYTDHGGYKNVSQFVPKGGTYLDIPPSKLIPYACYDGVGTVEIHDAHVGIVKKDNRANSTRNVGRILDEQYKFRLILSKMEYDGLRIDRKYTGALLKKYEGEMNAVESRLRRSIGKKRELEIVEALEKNPSSGKMNLHSSAQMAALFYGLPTKKQGVKVIARDDTGIFRGECIKGMRNHTTDDKARTAIRRNLKKMGGQKKLLNFLDGIDELHKLSKRITTYLRPFMEFPDGRAHCSFTQHVTRTGRPSGREPNFLNIPRDSDMRNCIRANPGNTFVDCDQTQLEMRIAAQYSGDDNMLRLLNDRNGKLHEFVGVNSIKKLDDFGNVIGLYDEEDFADGEMRIKAKVAGFSIIFGKMAETLSEDLGVSVEAAADIIHLLLNETFPGLGEWIKWQHAAIGRDGFVTTLFGRRIPIFGWNSPNWWEVESSKRKSVNYPVQSAASDAVVIGINRVDRRLKKEKMPVSLRLTVYDSLLAEMKNDKVLVGEYRKLAREEMEAPITELDKVRLFVDIKQGISWGKMKKVS